LLPGDVVRSHAATGRPTADRAAALASYYDSEVDDRATRALSDQREDHRDLFIDAVTNDGARSVLEIGCGPGIDATALAGAGLDYTGIDLSFAAVAMCRGKGLRVCTANAVDLPFTDNAFDAAWTMSTLLHLDDVEFESALREVRRVMRPGGLLAIGLWGDHVASSISPTRQDSDHRATSASDPTTTSGTPSPNSARSSSGSPGRPTSRRITISGPSSAPTTAPVQAAPRPNHRDGRQRQFGSDAI
jgi:SAM-dependent methyltransferase